MFECGLEGISLKCVKRSQFEKGDNGNEEKKTETEIFYTDSMKSRDELENTIGTWIAYPASDFLKTKYKTRFVFLFLKFLLASTSATTEPETAAANTSNTTQINSSATCASLVAKETNGNTSSCIIELKTVWFNFAAPPRTPITRKIDYTRLDWNLLSTASPAINAWMNPSNRFAIQVVHMVKSMYRRSTAIVACLMAEALDVQGIHMPAKVSLTSL